MAYPKDYTTPRDYYRNHREELDSPASAAFIVTPSQSNLPVTLRGLYVGVGGDIACAVPGGNTTHSSSNVLFKAVVAGTILPVRMVGVYDTSDAGATSAEFLVGLY